MRILLKGFLFCAFLITPLMSVGFQKVEDIKELVRVDIKFATDTSGIIDAYACHSCPPKSFVFNEKLIVLPHDERSFTQKLRALDGKPAVLTWKPNTVQALRIWPNF
ncbi:hypothetical protein [Endozoicomonas elysicola]|nr:hypothetical protein [Endozoicomonas elysicola]